MGFVDSIVKLGRLRELKFRVRLSLESRLVVGWILGLLQWVARIVFALEVGWTLVVLCVLFLRSLAIFVPSFCLPGGMSVGSVKPVVRRVMRALYSFSLSLEFLKSWRAFFILDCRVLCFRSHASWHSWQTLVLESFTMKLSSLQHMQAPGDLVLESGTSRLHTSQM